MVAGPVVLSPSADSAPAPTELRSSTSPGIVSPSTLTQGLLLSIAQVSAGRPGAGRSTSLSLLAQQFGGEIGPDYFQGVLCPAATLVWHLVWPSLTPAARHGNPAIAAHLTVDTHRLWGWFPGSLGRAVSSVQAGSPSSWSDVIPSSASLRRQRWLITPYSVYVHRASLEFSGALQRFCSLAQGWLSSVYLAGLWEGSVTQGRGGGPTTGGLAPLSPPGKPTVPSIVPLTHSLTNTSEQTGFRAPPPA